MTLFRTLVTITLFISFIVLWYWAWRTERRDEFAAAANLPLEDEAVVENKSC